MRPIHIRLIVVLVSLSPGTLLAKDAGVDVKAAERLLKKGKCTNCHSVTRDKEGPSFRSIAQKYRGNPEAEVRVFEHMTSSPEVCVDGHDESHEPLRFDDLDEVTNLARWVLSQ
ncbi:MAG: c-type cytochrome [Gammaproteobacteria bacterium]|jgi:cytochrome c|nr:c-type cytochrome [Gammaproteobacteria bacterium]